MIMPNDLLGWALVLGVFLAMLSTVGGIARSLVRREVDKRIKGIETNQVQMQATLDTVVSDLNNGVKAELAKTRRDVARIAGVLDPRPWEPSDIGRRHDDG